MLGIGHRDLSFKTSRSLLPFYGHSNPCSKPCIRGPRFRVDRDYVHSLRERSNFSNDWRIKWGSRPRPISGVANFFKCEDMKSLVRDATDPTGPKKININIFNLLNGGWWGGGTGTVKFRQHEGTLEGPRVTVWIKTLIGIIEFIENVHPVTLFNLLAASCKHEIRDKSGDGNGTGRQEQLQPIPAEIDFTIIHLFEYLSLWDSADHYKNKLFKHSKKNMEPLPRSRMEWDYESPNYDPSRKGMPHGLRLLWDDLDLAEDSKPATSKWKFDSENVMWPAHRLFSRARQPNVKFRSGQLREKAQPTTG